MGKQGLALLLAILFFIPTVFGFDMPTGANGKSAYEIAVENGFDGDFREWLLSLEGKDGKQEINTVITGGEGSSAQAASKALMSTVTVRTEKGGGSGVIIQLEKDTGDAYIVTNHHVTYNAEKASGHAEEITVYLYGMEYGDFAIPATYLGGSMQYDLAVLRVSGSELLRRSAAVACDFSEDMTPHVGETALAVGNSQGMGLSVTTGIVSVESEKIEMTAVDQSGKITYRSIRIDADINHGNSGGGLFNANGELIGVVYAKHNVDGVDGIGYAIPLSVVRAVTDNILAHCDGGENVRLRRVFIGVMVKLDDSYATLDGESGIVRIVERNMVDSVTPGALAEGILEVKDVFLSVRIDDRAPVTVTRQHHLMDEILYARAGSTITFTVERAGEIVERSITIPADALQDY